MPELLKISALVSEWTTNKLTSGVPTRASAAFILFVVALKVAGCRSQIVEIWQHSLNPYSKRFASVEVICIPEALSVQLI